jgi:hypothetical protein
MSSCALLDLNSGASLLPHVYCKKITLQNLSTDAFEGALVKVNLEILLKKDTFKNSALYNTVFNDATVKDFLRLQMVPFQNAANISKLIPSSQPASLWDAFGFNASVPNVYTAHNTQIVKNFLSGPANTNYLPHFSTSDSTSAPGSGQGVVKQGAPTLFLQESDVHNNLFAYDFYSTPILANASVNTQGLGANPGLGFGGGHSQQLSTREEVVGGESYYILSYEITYEFKKSYGNNLGFLFYCFLDVPGFLENSGLTADQINNMNVKSLVGPVNTEVVIANGVIATTKEQFFTDAGEEWNGSVHLHTEANPDISNPALPYFGDGSKGVAKGWMAGFEHVPASQQPKLSLFDVPNTIIEDLRLKTSSPLETVLGLTYDQEQKLRVLDTTPEQLALEDVMEYIISPFQKQTKKYLMKFDSSNAVTLYDNDTEYSKLYITRDVDNSSRGVFLIDFQQLLKNNSVLYSSLDQVDANTSGFAADIMPFSKLIELKVYRDRVKKKPIGNRYELYANDTLYEHPSELVGTIYDQESYGDSNSDGTIEEIFLSFSPGSNNSKQIRCFAFTDKQVGEMSAGYYQYRVECLFKDGTQDFLYNMYTNLVVARDKLEKYHALAQGRYSIPDVALSLQSTTISQLPESLSKKINIPYYKDGAYSDIFVNDSQNLFSSDTGYPWESGDQDNKTVALILTKLGDYFNFDNINSSKIFGPEGLIAAKLLPLLSPETGSPSGIGIAIMMADSIINHMESLLGLGKLSKSGSSLTSKIKTIGGYDLSNINFTQDSLATVSSRASIIKEHHSYDSPSEIFKALSNEDIYVDYLSAAEPIISNDLGPLRINVNDYRQRCILEASKLVKEEYASDIDSNFNTSGLTQSPGSLSDTGYQYMSPSIVRISDPGKGSHGAGSYHHHLSFFTQGDNGQVSYDNDIDLDSHHDILVALVNYSLNKKDIDDADLTPGYYTKPADLEIDYKSSTLKESYKDMFGSIGFAIYNEASYSEAYDKPAGALSPKIINPTTNKLISETTFNDKDVNDSYYTKIFYENNNVFNRPTGVRFLYPNNLDWKPSDPNIFKLQYKNIPLDKLNVLYADVLDVYNTPQNPGNIKNHSFYYIHSNLLAEVQVYDTTNVTSNLKNDDLVWRTLQKTDIDNLGDLGSLLCRYIMFEEKNSHDLKIPIINKIFILKTGNISAMATPIQFTFKVLDQFSLVNDFLVSKLDTKINKINKINGRSLLVGEATKTKRRVQRSSQDTARSAPLRSSSPSQPSRPGPRAASASTRTSTIRTTTRTGGYE